MELRPGYQQTEIGVIPEDWYVSNIDSIMSIIGDGLHGTPKYKNNGDYFFINGNNLVNGVINIFEATKRVDKLEYLKYRKNINNKTIFLSINGTIGSVACYLGESVILGKSIAFLNVNNNISKNYAFFYFQTAAIMQRFEDGLTGTTIKNLGLGTIRKTLMALPRSQAEQCVIAEALSDVDALIQGLDQLIAKKRDIKQAAMQELLTGQMRLPGFSDDWEVKSMRSLGYTYGGLTGKSKVDFIDGKSPYIPFMNVMTGPAINSEWLDYVDIPRNDVQNLAMKGDLFFNGSSETPEEVGFCSVLLENVPGLYLNSFCFGFRFHSGIEVNGLFFAYWFRCNEGRKVMAVLAQGATRYNIAKSAFLKLCLAVPSENEQTAIAAVLSDMDADINALEQRRDKTRELKQGMMQELLTGRIRLI